MNTAAYPHTARGVTASLGASGFFGLTFLLSGYVSTSPEVIFAWRVLATLGCYASFLILRSGRANLQDYWKILTARRSTPWVFLLLCVVVGIQLWLFVWAPANGKALDASLGFLLLPIVLVLGGRFAFNSPVSPLQWAAVGIAAVALVFKVLLTPAISWVTLFIALVYPVYFMLRKRWGLDHPAGFGVEVAVLTPLAVMLLLLDTAPAGTIANNIGVATIAFAGVLAMATYLGAARLLPLPLFGMLSYVEPLLLVAIALVLGEQLQRMDIVVYSLLAIALAVLAVEGSVTGARRTKRQ